MTPSETRTKQLDTGVELTARYRQWSYDGAQGRAGEDRTGGWSAVYANNDLDQVTGISGSMSEGFTYDWAGNLVEDGTWTYTYDAENRLIKMQQHSGGTLRLEFVYDYLGRRIEKAVYPTSGASTPSSRTRFVYDGWNLIAELNALSSNAVLRTYTWGLDASGSLQGAGGVGGLVRMEEGGTAYHPVYDQSNNVTGLVRTSGTTATLVASYTYGPYGEKLQPDWAAGGYTDNNPFRYSTRYTDKETGLVYYGMRYYQPKTGRFINRDPIGEEGGLNLYGFVGNNPVNRFDILGMEGSGRVTTLDPFFVDATPWRGSLLWYRELSFRLIPPESPRPNVRIPDRLKEVVAPNNTDVDCGELKQQLAIARSVGEKALSRVAQNGGDGSLLDVLSTIENANALSGLSAGFLAYGQQLRLDINNTTINSRYGPLTRYTNVRPSTVQNINHAGAAFGLLGMGIDSYQAGTAALNSDWSGAVSNVASAGLNGTIILIAGSNPVTALAAGSGAVVIGVSEQLANDYLARRDRRWNEQHLRNDQRLATDAASKVAGLEAQIARDCP